MRSARALAFAVSAIVLMAACTSGQTEVQGLPDVTGATGVTSETGPTGATGETAPPQAGEAFSLVFDIPPAAASAISEAAFFTCEGLEGTWRYIFRADFGIGIEMDVDTTVNMQGGDGRMVFGGEINFEGIGGSVGWEDTVDLAIVGTPDAPAPTATNVKVQLSGNIEGVPVSAFETFQENQELPIVPGSDRC
jgi:hypothetical protein